MPGSPFAPMLASTGVLPLGAGWAYEFKWDGVRAISSIEGGRVRLFARSGAEITVAYPELAALASTVPSAVLDGEIVVLDEAGRPSFGALAERIHVRERARAAKLAASRPVTYMIFDVLSLDGADLCRRPYAERRELLDDLGLAGDHWLTPPVFTDGVATRDAAQENALEGVVAKRLTSVYRPGQRSADWVKVKLDTTAEFVVGGWRPGARALGALLVGVPGKQGLAYRGRVGGGISDASERALLAALAPIEVLTSPFATDVPRPDATGARWVRPELVVEVRFGQLTADERLRFPRFVRLRPDRTAAEVSEVRDQMGTPNLTRDEPEAFDG
ncbi:MAG TPA: non-homologous end-joining DNA ligase [Micromonosporaceae bacterium]|nr:non-homologous end-joining DNA ligase [Micromonosporaceae bacterium]